MKQPVLFIGHGSPMAAIEETKWSECLRSLGEKLLVPQAILLISAHWETAGLKVCAVEKPRTIHDFSGFPPALYQLRYPAMGSLRLAKEVQRLTGAELDFTWGLDHGAWSVLLHLFPKADVPVVQLSLNQDLSEEQHWSLAEKLSSLREQGVLVIGSGNIVHHLGRLKWDEPEGGLAWAREFDRVIARALGEANKDDLIYYQKFGQAAELSVPTKEHYWPLLYAAALAEEGEVAQSFYVGYAFGALSMRSVGWGL